MPQISKEQIEALEKFIMCTPKSDDANKALVMLQGLLDQPEWAPVCYVQLGTHGRVFSMNDTPDSECVTPLYTHPAPFTQLQAEVEALRKDAEWQPIETAPKDSFSRLYMVNGRCMQGFIDSTGMLCAQTDYHSWRKMYGTPTHWKPLPKPPAIKGEQA
jgi:hypothetical protein